ncbi:thioredoxin domain-containing protein [Salinicoccus albus]|uniref:thioredoxin domain-containing protein n=1 Tax=Salinicoccus albus TaxID=418756 RepID=UPI0003785587|nr:thioredoxin domain-containing protein [Salinicoccus albus]
MTEYKVKPLQLGSEAADTKVEVFLNLACPFSINFFKAADKVIKPQTEAGHISYTIKHFDKPKVRLLHGAIANQFLDPGDTENTYNVMKALFEDQEAWVSQGSTAIQQKMTEAYGLSEQADAVELSLAVTGETLERGISSVPTVFIDGKELDFDVKRGPTAIEKVLRDAIQ